MQLKNDYSLIDNNINMKKLYFVKMHWTWNDFVLINNDDLEKSEIILTKKLIKNMCCRHFWIWSDWVLVVSKWKKVAFKYVMYNTDGSQAEMCGNGIRCYMKYLLDKWLIWDKNIDVETDIWIYNLSIDNNTVTVDMWKPSRIKNLIYKSKNLWDRFPLKIDNDEFIFTPVSMWNPHAVIFCRDSNILCELLEKLDIHKYWKKIENHTDIFPNKTNVEFVKIKSEKEIMMRVWERWVWETLSCWTWACAAVVAWILAWKLLKDKFIKVDLPGWILEVKWSWNLSDSVIMRWDAVKVFDWYYYIY